MPDEAKTVTIEDAEIIWRNFEGRKEQYNERGDKLFTVVLHKPLADDLANDGWNVRCRPPDDEGEEFCHLQIKVNFENRPPTVILISPSTGVRTVLNSETVAILDSTNIRTADLIFRSYNWDVNGKQGIKAYLQSLYVTVEEDELQRKYATNYEDSSA